jgi:hypothetical protein
LLSPFQAPAALELTGSEQQFSLLEMQLLQVVFFA